jgi:DNA-binding CsgD family transcriptional regulator
VGVVNIINVEPRGNSDPQLLERDRALGTIRGALEGVLEGPGATVFVAGAAGMGKTSVLEAGRRAAEQAGCRVASGVGSRMEMGLPFGLVGQAIAALGGSELDDPAELERLGGQLARLYRMFRWLTDVAADRPLLFALDDLHWADPDSLELLGFACRRLAGCRILVVGCLRPEPDPAWTLARELVGSGHASVISLAPLSAHASRALLEENMSRELDPDQSRHVVTACAGTPLLLKAAAASLSGAGSPPALSAGDRFGWSLLLERFAGLGDGAFRFVLAGSILGVRFRPELAGELAGLDQFAWRAAHVRLVRGGLLEDLEGGWTGFIHPLFAQALLESQPHSERERAHAGAFRLLVERGEPDALAAEHAHAARMHGDSLAIEITARAGRQALGQGALEVAAVHLGNAVELAGRAAPADLLLSYAHGLAARARNDQTERVCERLLKKVDLPPAIRASTLALLAQTAMLAGRPQEAERRCEEAATVAATVDAPTEAATLVGAAMACNLTSPLPWTLATIARALSIAPPDAPVRRSLEYLGALARLQSGDPVGEALLADESRRWSTTTEQSSVGAAAMLAVWTVGAMSLLEDLEGVTEVFERQFARAVEDGAPVAMTALAIGYADCLQRMGRPAEAVELVKRTVALTGWPMPPWHDLAVAVNLTDLGRDEDALAHIAAVRSFTARVPSHYYAVLSLWLCVLDGRRLLAAGRPEQASDTMLRAAEISRLTGWRNPCIVLWAQTGVEAHLAAGRIEHARELIDDVDALSRPLSARWPRAVVALGRAQLAASDVQADEVDARFARALALFAELPMPTYHAEALISYGSHLRHSGRPRDAREPLARALALCEHAGAERIARQARAELAACGGRRRRSAADESVLTAQEERVAAMAADSTNAQIAAALGLSPKTVGHYLERIYSKLGIRSRHELSGRMAEHERRHEPNGDRQRFEHR